MEEMELQNFYSIVQKFSSQEFINEVDLTNNISKIETFTY